MKRRKNEYCVRRLERAQLDIFLFLSFKEEEQERRDKASDALPMELLELDSLRPYGIYLVLSLSLLPSLT